MSYQSTVALTRIYCASIFLNSGRAYLCCELILHIFFTDLKMRIFVVLSVYIALATCHRINREAGYNYEVSNGSYEQEPIPSIQQNSFQYNDQSLQHTASADHHFHASNQQYDEVAQNGGNANYAQPQQQIAEITNDNSNYAPVQYQHNSGSHSISAHPNEYVQQSGLDRFNAAGNTFNRNDGQHIYSQDFTDSFSTTHQHSLSTPHRLIQSDTFSRNTFPVVNPAGDSIVVEAPSAPSAPSGPSAPPAQPTPIQSVSAPIEHYPTPITEVQLALYIKMFTIILFMAPKISMIHVLLATC